MHHLTESDIHQKLIRYLTGKMSLRAFHEWLVPATWDVEEWGSDSLQEMVSGIKHRLAEYSSGHWTKKELRNHLLPFATSFTVLVHNFGEETLASAQPQWRSSSRMIVIFSDQQPSYPYQSAVSNGQFVEASLS
jgi:hypothetical protein